MRLSELIVEDFKVREPAISIYDDFITDVVYGKITDDNKNNEWRFKKIVGVIWLT